MADEEIYQEWLEQRRREQAPAGLADRVMQALPEDLAGAAPRWLLARLLLALAASRFGRFAVCLAAFLIGITPYLYLAFLARLIGF